MKQLSLSLIHRLKCKGLTPVEISRLLKDSALLMSEKRPLSGSLLSRKLERIGWERDLIDALSYDLILYFIENRRIGEVTFQAEALVADFNDADFNGRLAEWPVSSALLRGPHDRARNTV